MSTRTSAALTFAEKCRSILASNWEAHLHTIKGELNGSKDIYKSKVKYIMRKGEPYLWIPENDMHNLNVMFDERCSLAIASPYPGALGKLLKVMNKFPARVALTGELVRLSDQKAQTVADSLKEIIRYEERMIRESDYAVSTLLSTSDTAHISRGCLKELADAAEGYSIYKFNMSGCTLIDGHGCSHEVGVKDIGTGEEDQLAFFSAKLIDCVNRDAARRRALILFCLVYMNEGVRDALIYSLDRKGFDLLGKVPTSLQDCATFQWKEFRFLFSDCAIDVKGFAEQLIKMEEGLVAKITQYSGLS